MGIWTVVGLIVIGAVCEWVYLWLRYKQMNHDTDEDIYCTRHSSGVSHISDEIEQDTSKRWDSIMLCGPLEAQFLKFLVQFSKAKRALELGCFTGYSAWAVAEALPEDGQIVTCELKHETAEIARKNFQRGDKRIGDKITLFEGPAMDYLNKAEGQFDFIFIDADKGNQINYLNKILEQNLLSETGIIAVDNTLFGGLVAHDWLRGLLLRIIPNNHRVKESLSVDKFNKFVVSDKRVEVLQLPLVDGITLITKRRP
ncbi:O-methyltransferase MysB [Pelomyxa schiedti]|nr:O-methyltransferase MysB [Pelomyxa schiedti]